MLIQHNRQERVSFWCSVLFSVNFLHFSSCNDWSRTRFQETIKRYTGIIPGESTKCPDSSSNCTCSLTTVGWYADCSSKSLTSIPQDLPKNMSILYIRDNQISQLEDGDLEQYEQLIVLDLSFNEISKLRENSLKTPRKLKVLYLNSNFITMTNRSIPQNVFNDLKDIEVLTLHDNLWNDSQQGEYRDDLFWELNNVQQLSIDGIPNVKFGKGFSSLKNLRVLEVFGRLTVILNDTFQTFAGLPIVSLNIKSDRNLTRLESTSFSHFNNLETLDLGFNRAIDLDQVSDAWYGLQYTKIKSLILTRVISPSIQTTNINAVFYNYLKDTQIRNLRLDKNNIVITEPGISRHLPFLVHLDMSFNRLSNVGSLIADFGYMRRLKYLDASHQIRRYNGISKRNAPDEITNGNAGYEGTLQKEAPKEGAKEALQREVLKGGAALPCISNSNVKLCPPIRKENGSYPVEVRGPWCFIFPPKLETFNLSASLSVDLQYMPQLIGLGGFHLKEILYRENGIKYLSGPFILSNPNPDIHLVADFSGNGLTCIAVDLLKWTVVKGGRVGKLFLSNNNLASQLAEDTTGEMFKYYGNLTELRLDRNGIKSLPVEIFSLISNLVTLNLSGNSIRLLDFKFDNMKDLRFLDISDNLITNVFSETLNELDAMMTRSNLSLNLRGNPILCSCDSIDFLQWILGRNEHLTDFNQYSCLFGNSSVTFDNLAGTILPVLNFKCSTRTALRVAAGLLAFVIVVVGIAIAAYRSRWDIRFFFLRFRTRRKDFVDYEEIRRNYDYDAFVIYDKEDQWWVRDELDAKLSENHSDPDTDETDSSVSLRLCIHGRDFQFGEPIEQNIVSSILKSRKIIVVLSPNFLDSKWCAFELELSHLENINRGINTIVPIILEEFEARRNMSPTLKRILKNLTYLEWPRNASCQQEFWKQLRKTLRPRVNNTF